MSNPLNIILATLLFPVLIYLFVFDRIPVFTRIFSHPVDVDVLAASARQRRQADRFGDDDRPTFSPTARQQLETRTLLLRLLPPELVLPILSFASYHSLISTLNTRKAIIANASRAYLLSAPFPRAGRVEEVRIAVRSKDQGWSSYPGEYGSYRSTSSFFQTYLLRPTARPPAPVSPTQPPSLFKPAPVQPQPPWYSYLWSSPPPHEDVTDLVDLEVPDTRSTVQYNVHAGQFLKTHLLPPIFRFRPYPSPSPLVDAGFHPASMPHRIQLALARPGDRIALDAVARYVGWENRVAAARVDMYVSYYHGPPQQDTI